MKVLVTGASGFFGSQLVPYLIEHGHDVRTFGRSLSIPQFSHLPVEHVSGDIGAITSILSAVKGSDAVIHMAGLVSYRAPDYEALYQANVLGSRNVMDAVLQAGDVQRVIHLSSIAGMGIPPHGVIADESFEYNLAGRNLHYCDTKHESEMVVLSYAQKGLPVLVLSPGITFGEGDNHPHHHTIFSSMARGGLIGYPRGGVMFSDIKDVVLGISNALTMGKPGERYVIGSDNMTFRDAAVALSEIIGCKPPSFAIPPRLSELAGVACEAICPIFGLTPRLTWQSAWLSQHNIFFSSDKAIRELDYKQTPFRETIRRTASHYLGSIQEGLPGESAGARTDRSAASTR